VVHGHRQQPRLLHPPIPQHRLLQNLQLQRSYSKPLPALSRPKPNKGVTGTALIYRGHLHHMAPYLENTMGSNTPQRLDHKLDARLAVRSIWKSLKAFRATLRFIAAHAEISLAVGMNSNSILTSRAAETACSRCETGKSFEGNKLCDLTTSEIVSGIRRPTRFMA
jgi:hypothetical protein